MAHSIKTVYVVHHSHTDIGYTDLQERVIAIQVNYIKTVLSMMRQPEYADFRWNCETLYCVEEFWKQASEDDRADFARFVKEGKIGISANYLNFNDLVNADVFGKRLAKWQDKLQPFGTKIHTAMAADVNGFSMGYRDAMIENGVEFFFTNVHCHHGMYPLYQNQNAFFWENASGQRLLVWNGEHYNLGNVLGLQPNHAVNWMMRNRLGEDADAGTSFSDQLHTNLDKYLTECETEGYSYDFIVTAVSGVFSDNAPPSAEIMETIRAYNEKYGQEVRVEMVSLQELYAAIAPKLTDAPVYRGDWTDWWANGVGSTPYAVKHYKDADHRWQLANRLDPDAEARYPALSETVQDNLMLYAEHTWGHSSTITNPYDTMVLNLDMRKNSYASKAHEAASLMLCSIPRIDFTLELGKTISDEVESVFLSLDLNRPGNETVLRKGAREAFRPGIDQLPGTCMEFYMSDDGAARLSPEGGVLIAARDVPMFYTGEMQHHPIRLCDGAAENNARPLYSWVMNNNWETNFKMDLSGFCQYDYSLWLTDISDPEQAMDELHEQLFDPYVLIVR